MYSAVIRFNAEWNGKVKHVYLKVEWIFGLLDDIVETFRWGIVQHVREMRTFINSFQ